MTDEDAHARKQREIEQAWWLHERSRDPAFIRRRLMEELLLAQESRCYYCRSIIVPGHSSGRRRATVDHVIPKALGGVNSRDNLVAACEKCNFEKADQLWKEGCRQYPVGRTDLA